MTPGDCGFTPDEIKEIYEELDLHEEGITEEEVTRRKTRIFVGGLKFASEDHVLHDYFATFGKIKEAVVIRDRKTGLSKGYGFVTMLEDLPALKAIVDKSPKLDGRRCNVNLAYIGQKKKPLSKRSYPKLRDMQHLPPQIYPNGIMVPPAVMMPDGQYYHVGMHPMHGQQPIYQLPIEAPPPYDGRGELYQGQMAMMYQNPVLLPQPIVFDNPAGGAAASASHPVTNNNNNNIYLTNNIYYHSTDTYDGKDNTKLSFCGPIPPNKPLPQYILPQPLSPHLQPNIVPASGNISVIDSNDYNNETNEMQPIILSKNTPDADKLLHMDHGSQTVNNTLINSYAVINSSNDGKVQIGVANFVNETNAHVVVATANTKNGDTRVTSFASSKTETSSSSNMKIKSNGLING